MQIITVRLSVRASSKVYPSTNGNKSSGAHPSVGGRQLIMIQRQDLASPLGRQHTNGQNGRYIHYTDSILKLTIVARRQLFRCGGPAEAPVARVLPRGAPLDVPVLGQIPGDRFPQQRDVEVPPLGRFALVLVQLLVDAPGQLGPVRVQAALPARRVARKQPVLVAVGPEAVAPFLLSLTGARALQKY